MPFWWPPVPDLDADSRFWLVLLVLSRVRGETRMQAVRSSQSASSAADAKPSINRLTSPGFLKKADSHDNCRVRTGLANR